MYSSASTIKQFIEFRNKFKGKPQKRLSRESFTEYITNEEHEKHLADRKEKAAKLILTTEQTIIINGFEQLRINIFNERQSLKAQYGDANGIKIDFRGKTTTSKSAMRTLQYEIMRINTLITCNKLRDKVIMAQEFHLPLDEFLRILQDPNQYLKFSDAQISHLNQITAPCNYSPA